MRNSGGVFGNYFRLIAPDVSVWQGAHSVARRRVLANVQRTEECPTDHRGAFPGLPASPFAARFKATAAITEPSLITGFRHLAIQPGPGVDGEVPGHVGRDAQHLGCLRQSQAHDVP